MPGPCPFREQKGTTPSHSRRLIRKASTEADGTNQSGSYRFRHRICAGVVLFSRLRFIQSSSVLELRGRWIFANLFEVVDLLCV
ncbi:hypothetical protein NPIL_503991, partial [Nephila pilipes]